MTVQATVANDLPTPTEFGTAFQALEREIGKVVVGHQEAVRRVLVAFFAGGHVLIEGVPGIGKTLIVRSLGQALALSFSRVPWTRYPTLLFSGAGEALRTHPFQIREVDAVAFSAARGALGEAVMEGYASTFGKPGTSASSFACSSRSCSSPCFTRSLRADISSSSSGDGFSPRALAWPISRESLLRVA